MLIIMANEKTSLDYYLMIKMLDEMSNFVLSIRNLEGNPQMVLKDTALPEDRFQLLSNFDPFRHINAKEFILNMGSLLISSANKYGFTFSPEYAMILKYLKDNGDQLYIMGDLVAKFDEEKNAEKNSKPFYL